MSLNPFEKVLEFIDSYTLDSQLYWRVKQLYTDKEFEIQWTGSKMWRFKLVEHTFWVQCGSDHIIQQLTENKVDLLNFELQVRNTALEQVVGAESIVKAGRELFGDETVEQHIEAWDNFREELVSALNKIMEEKETEKKKSKLTVVKNDD